MAVKDMEMPHLRRCVELAAEALEAGDEPFGSVLVGGDGTVLGEDHNRVASGDRTRHPEFELARWSAAHLTPAERSAATVYTSASTARCARPRMPGSASAGSSTSPRPSNSPPGWRSWVSPHHRSGHSPYTRWHPL